jgi:hypothetical protein
MASSGKQPRFRRDNGDAIEADPTDVAAQRQEVDPRLEPDVDDEELPLEAEPADVVEQRRKAMKPRFNTVPETPIPAAADPADVADQQRDALIDEEGQEP